MDAFAAEAEDDSLSRPPSSKPVHRSHSNIVHAHTHAGGSNRPASAPPISSPTGAGSGSIGITRPAAASASASASAAYGRQGQGLGHAGPSRLGGKDSAESGKGREEVEAMRHREQVQLHAPSSSAGPSSPIRPDRGRMQETRLGGATAGADGDGQSCQLDNGAREVEDPDRTFVHSTPASTSPYSPRSAGPHVNAHLALHNPHIHADSNGSPVPIVRQPRPSRSPLRHRSDMQNGANTLTGSVHADERATTRQMHSQTAFNPTLPPLQQISFSSASLPAHGSRAAPDSPMVPIGTKRAAPYDVDLDLDVDVDLDMDGGQDHRSAQVNTITDTNTNTNTNDASRQGGFATPTPTYESHSHTHTHTHAHIPVSVPMPMPIPAPVSVPPVTPTNNRQGARKRRNLQGGEKGDEGLRKGKKGGL
jgi:hypothetical protein